jgi:hypothetical protein
MGEGVRNDMLTARVGLSAFADCRPAPFAVTTLPGVSDIAHYCSAARGPGERAPRRLTEGLGTSECHAAVLRTR